MAGVEEIIINDHYLIMVAIALFFTAMTLVSFSRSGWNPSVTKYISETATTITYFIAGAAHVAASPNTSPLFPLSYLYFAFAIMFLLVFIVDMIQAWRIYEKKKPKAAFKLRDASFKGRGLHPDMQGATWEQILEKIYEGRGG